MSKIEEIESDFNHALKALELTKITLAGDQSKNARQLLAGINKYSKTAHQASNYLSKASTATNIIDAASSIKNIARYLRNTKSKERIPAVEAYVYGQLFATAGKVIKFLPFPASMYGDLLIGAEDFFSNMWDVMNPESEFTPRGRMMKKLTEMEKKHIVEKGDPCTYTLNYNECRRNLTN